MNKFTPGPWKFFDHSREVGGGDPYTEHIYDIQARGYKKNNTFEYPHICSVSKIEDARLIAAAPELLQLCQELLGHLEAARPDLGETPLKIYARSIMDKAGGK